MNRKKALIPLLLVFLLMLGGCKGFKYSFTSFGGSTKIEVNGSEGDYAESSDFEVGKNRQIVLKSELESGQLQIDFAEATVFYTDSDSPADVIIGDVVTSVKIGKGETLNFDLPQGDYVMCCTCIGTTKGVVTMDIEKK